MNHLIMLTQEQINEIKKFYERETAHWDLGDRDAIGAETGITGVLDILGIIIDGVND